jgi:signal transduction histidine kinase
LAVSDKLAYEIYTIIFCHVIAVAALFSFSLFLYLRAKKTPLLYSYLGVAAAILLWMISKILKTVAPTEGLRWLFVVTQYLGIDFLGFSLIVFAYIYARGTVPARKHAVLLAILPVISFAVLVTNPLHMGFYSYFDFYKDRFGSLFFIFQSIQYIYWVLGIWMLSRGFTKQPGFHGKKTWAMLFAAITLIPVAANFYYILFKLDVFDWFFPFPVFDFTPIACTAALILFTIPAMTFRFFDISPISYARLYEEVPRGLVFMNRQQTLYGGNTVFYRMFGLDHCNFALSQFVEQLAETGTTSDALCAFALGKSLSSELTFSANNHTYRVTRKSFKRGRVFFCFTEITPLVLNNGLLEEQQAQLLEKKQRLAELSESNRTLAAARAKARAAQDMHDILGHSLTVVIGTTEMAAADQDSASAANKLTQIGELLTSSLNDLRNTLSGIDTGWEQTSLIKAITHLKNGSIDVDITTQGAPYELVSAQTEAVFRLCQEAITNAIKHGRARNIHIVLRYKQDSIEVFAINDGLGCREINKNYGLTGIENRINELSGRVEFGSDGEKGFTVHAVLPRVR